MKIKKNDHVIIITGKDKGKTGKVLTAIPSLEKIIVESINIRKRHLKPKKQGEKGQIAQIPSAIHISNAMLLCSKCSKPTRVGYRVNESGKFRVCKKCKEII